MKLFYAFLFAVLATVGMKAQCDGYGTLAHVASYSYRDSNLLTSYSQAYTTGSDAAYTTTGVTQVDKLNGVEYAQPLSASIGPGGVAQTSRTVDINAQGFGTYETDGTLSSYDGCTGISSPPFNNGDSFTSVATLQILQPRAVGGAPLYVADMSNCVPNASCFPYVNRTGVSANSGAITGTPVWHLSGSTQMVTLSCTACQTATLTATSAAVGSCTPALQAYYSIDGLNSSPLNIMVLGPQNADYGSAVHSAVSGGYLSQWPFQLQTSCGSPMWGVKMNETFPNGFNYKIANTDWPTPVANPWTNDSNGLYVDSIGEVNTVNPPALAPQNPLGSTVIFDGNQYFNVVSTSGNVPAGFQVQAHYQDHGGYE